MSYHNRGKPWGAEEVTALKVQLQAGTSLDEVARLHGRTRRAIELRVLSWIPSGGSKEEQRNALIRDIGLAPEDAEELLSLQGAKNGLLDPSSRNTTSSTGRVEQLLEDILAECKSIRRYVKEHIRLEGQKSQSSKSSKSSARSAT